MLFRLFFVINFLVNWGIVSNVCAILNWMETVSLGFVGGISGSINSDKALNKKFQKPASKKSNQKYFQRN
jgi:hypothetical protein